MRLPRYGMKEDDIETYWQKQDSTWKHKAHAFSRAKMIRFRRYHFSFPICLLFTALWWLLQSGGDARNRQGTDTFNSTLGFEKVFVISMPKRTDRHDNFAMAASFAEYEFEFADGVDEDQIHHSTIPPRWEKKEKGALGCRRAHLNLLQKIVRERIRSALIIEDDSDFDVNIKQQLRNFAQAAVALQPRTRSPLQSPYGNRWDMLWLGYCMIGSRQTLTTYHITENDPTVAPLPKRHALFMDKKFPSEILSNDTRLTFQTKGEGLCTYAQAFSFEGARKALTALSQSPRNSQIDYSYQELCRGSYEGVPFNCYSTYPPLFGSHRPSGSNSRDTDMDRPLDYDDKWHSEYSFDIVYSTKINMMQHLVKGKDVVTAQWPKDVKEPQRRLNEPLNTGRMYINEIDVSAQSERTVLGVNNFPNSGWNVRPTTYE